MVVLGIGLVIFFHELGHFMVAKWCNVHVERFSIGIGPILWSRQKGETEYALSALPFGGYVKMLGQDDMDPNQMTSDEIAENARAYSAKTVPQRMAIISAGVIMNIITGFMFYMFCYHFGLEEPSPIVGAVDPGLPAWQAGLRAGDRITVVNGKEIRSFPDIFNGIVLSSGAVRVEGIHEDGTKFDEVITPAFGRQGRQIGIEPSQTPRLSPDILNADDIPMKGSPAAKASGKFQPGDRLVKLHGQEINTFTQLQQVTARFADQELVYEVQRPKSAEPGTGEEYDLVSITVPPAKVRSVGLWMAVGPIKSIQKGSKAEQAGMKPNDQIIAVDDQVVGKDIDPLQLPNYFSSHAGQSVKVTVERPDKVTQKIDLNIVPDDIPAWTEVPRAQTHPLPISSIGAAFQILPRIAKIVPGSEAERLGKFQVGQKVTRVELISPPEPKSETATDEKEAASVGVPDILKLSELEEKFAGTGTIEDINWAWAFHTIQLKPDSQLRIHVEAGSESVALDLKERESIENWSTSIRGISGWERAVDLQKADSFSDAFSLSLWKTKNTTIDIYKTLRSLIRGDLPPSSLSGPLQIANIGYKVAQRGLPDLLVFLGFLSINLAVINFLPIPVLDGGHMVFLLWEGITRRKPSARVIGWAHGMGFLFIITLFVFVMYLDVFVNKLGFGG
ncbi:MAG: site-2 protease family protein [Planctomyces sp.]|nr:site-2 protease family protein [Planctomyces sp.]